MAQIRPPGCCWGTISGGTGWDGIKRSVMGYCDKRPRPGCLTCWWHRWQENDAQSLRKRNEKEADRAE